MTYQLHITRAADWMHSSELPITAAEWLKLVRSDPELTLDPTRGAHFAHWSGSTGRDRWLEWEDGRINSPYPDSTLLQKLVAIAERFGAKVQGDGGEVYSGAERVDEWTEEDDLPYTPRQVMITQRLPWWRQILRKRVARW